jgi:hypothetical protein
VAWRGELLQIPAVVAKVVDDALLTMKRYGAQLKSSKYVSGR